MNVPEVAESRVGTVSSSRDHDEYTHDAFLGGRFMLRQPVRGLRAGSDAMLLAAAVPVSPGDRLIEAGIGTGAAALAILAREPELSLTGLELDPGHASLARRNAADNAFERQLRTLEIDIAEATTVKLRDCGVSMPVDHVYANPPYFDAGRSRPPPDPGRRAARIADRGDLDIWISRLADWVRGGGTATVIHRAEALGKLLAAIDGRLGGVVVLPLCARQRAEAGRVIVQATKGSRAPLRLLPPLVLHEADGTPTYEARAILHDAARLDLSQTPAGIVP